MVEIDKKPLLFRWILIAFTCAASPAYANAGLPMIVVTLPAMAIALIPIILIESFFLKKNGIAFKPAIKWVAIGNGLSTLVGIPCTWIALVGIQFASGGGGGFAVETFWGKVLAVTVQAPWIIDYGKGYEWMFPVSALFLLIPFFWISYCIETLFLRYGIKEVPKETIQKLCFKANLISYALLALLPLGMLIFQSAK